MKPQLMHQNQGSSPVCISALSRQNHPHHFRVCLGSALATTTEKANAAALLLKHASNWMVDLREKRSLDFGRLRQNPRPGRGHDIKAEKTIGMERCSSDAGCSWFMTVKFHTISKWYSAKAAFPFPPRPPKKPVRQRNTHSAPSLSVIAVPGLLVSSLFPRRRRSKSRNNDNTKKHAKPKKNPQRLSERGRWKGNGVAPAPRRQTSSRCVGGWGGEK